MIDAPNATDLIDAVVDPDEELITLSQAAGLLPRIDGRKVSVCTLWRWCRKGPRGCAMSGRAGTGADACRSAATMRRWEHGVFLTKESLSTTVAVPAGIT